MDSLTQVVGLISPSWIIDVLIGAFWTGIATVAVPPRAEQFPRILVAGVIGAVIGQLGGEALSLALLMVGNVHIAVASLGAVLVLGVVRLFSA